MQILQNIFINNHSLYIIIVLTACQKHGLLYSPRKKNEGLFLLLAQKSKNKELAPPLRECVESYQIGLYLP